MFDFLRNKKLNTSSSNYNEYQQKNYELKLANLESKYTALKQEKEYYEREYKKLKGLTESLCKSIVSNRYNIDQLGGSNFLQEMDIYKLIEYTKMDYQRQKIESIETQKRLNEQIQMQAILISNLKEQLAKAVLENNGDITPEEVEKAQIIDNTGEIDPPAPKVVQIERSILGDVKKVSTNSTTEKPRNSVSPNSPVINFATNQKVNSTNSLNQQENSPTLTIENIDAYMSTMTNVMWVALEAIGKEGLAESNDILDWINEKYPNKYNKSSVFNSLTVLKRMNIIKASNISTGCRRFQIFEMTPKGEEIFKAKFKMVPKESEIHRIIRDHDNVIHGYTIKDARELLIKAFGCTDAVMDREKVAIKLPNNETYIPDIIATKADGTKMYIEVELGNTPQKDFENKCRKMLQVTKDLYFITDTEDTLKNKLERQIYDFILHMGGKEKVAGTTFYMTTMTQLSKGEFSKVMKY